MFAVEQIGNEEPKCSTPHILEKLFPVTVLKTHLPAERKVKSQQRVSNIDKYGVHPCKQMHSEHFWIRLADKIML